MQAEWLGKALDAFDKCEWLERHAFYNWVEDARSVVIDNKPFEMCREWNPPIDRPAMARDALSARVR